MTKQETAKIAKLPGAWSHWDTSEKGWEIFIVDYVDSQAMIKVLRVLNAKTWTIEGHDRAADGSGALRIAVKRGRTAP